MWQLSQGPWKMVEARRWCYKRKLPLAQAKTFEHHRLKDGILYITAADSAQIL